MKSRIYLDNAATTKIDPLVVKEMTETIENLYGNPSSIHADGRKAKVSIETSRKKIAELLNTSPSEIFFTSGGTEADNMAICSSIETLGLTHIITSKIEHHAVLHTVERLGSKCKVSYVELDQNGSVKLDSLESLLKNNERSLVTLMHGNNEIGNLIDLNEVNLLCKKYNAVFHSDTVQTLGHYPHNLAELDIDFVVGAAHKFHGPKGVGFLYINAKNKIKPYITGGAQERNMRAGTENLYGIVGMAKALEIAYQNMEANKKHIKGLKTYAILELKKAFPGIAFNGNSGDTSTSLNSVLNACFPPHKNNDMILFNLDIEGISCSGGSACSSGTDIGSHVLTCISAHKDHAHVRFSFGKYNQKEEIDELISKLKAIFN